MIRNELNANWELAAGRDSDVREIRNVSPLAVRKARAAIQAKRAKRGWVSRLVSFLREVL